MSADDQTQKAPPPFDEQAALDNLASLQRELEESRRRRKDASAAFDNFVSSFHKGPADGAAAATPRPEYRGLSSGRSEAPPLPSTAAAAKRRTSTRRPGGLLAAGVVVFAAGVLLVRAWRGSSSDQPSAPAAAVHAPAATQPASSGGAASGTDEASVVSAAPAELIAIRDVWVRAIVDGRRVLERELEAGTRVPLRGRTIVVRAGNAGAVRMIVDGRDRGPLGGEGAVLTRTYTSTTAQ